MDSSNPYAAFIGDVSLDSLLSTFETASRQIASRNQAYVPPIQAPVEIVEAPSLIMTPDDVEDELVLPDTSFVTSAVISGIPDDLEGWLTTVAPQIKKYVDQVTFLPNMHEKVISGIREISGCIISVPYYNMSLPIPTSIIDPDRMFYGISFLFIPRIIRTEALYTATPKELGVIIEDIEFESEEPTDFIGIFRELYDAGTHFEERLWLVVQCGDATESNNWYEKLMDKYGNGKSEKTSPNKSGFYNMFSDDARRLYYGHTQAAIREKRVKIMKSILTKFNIEYESLEMNGSMLYHQEKNSIRPSDDGSVFFLLFGCFVVEGSDIFIISSPQRGIFRIEHEESKTLRDNYANAVPYDTGILSEIASRTITIKDRIPCAIGPSDKINSCVARPMTTEFKNKLGMMGLSLLNNSSQLHPLVFRMF
jgi:hypothetical protein